MSDVALFHSSLGVRPGITDAAARLRADGHQVLVVDQYDGRIFDDYGDADRFVEQVGFPELMRRAVHAVRDLPDGFLTAGFSNGAGMAEYVATQRTCRDVLMLSGALPVAMLGAPGWPAGVPARSITPRATPTAGRNGPTPSSTISAPQTPPSRSSTTQATATCSPTPASQPSTTSTPPRCCGSAPYPSAAHPATDLPRSVPSGDR